MSMNTAHPCPCGAKAAATADHKAFVLMFDTLWDTYKTGLKTEAGQIARQIAEAYPGYVIVEEALDLSDCPGQKRYRYKGVHVNAKNRHGKQFVCRSCGRKAHADVIGAKNQLGRSENKLISRYPESPQNLNGAP